MVSVYLSYILALRLAQESEVHLWYDGEASVIVDNANQSISNNPLRSWSETAMPTSISPFFKTVNISSDFFLFQYFFQKFRCVSHAKRTFAKHLSCAYTF